jgi:hypothetical protein
MLNADMLKWLPLMFIVVRIAVERFAPRCLPVLPACHRNLVCPLGTRGRDGRPEIMEQAFLRLES